MIGQRRDRELDPLARIMLALPVERLMVGVFVNQHHRQQARPGKAPGNGMERRRRLRDLLAGAAAELLPHVLGHEPLPRHDIERLGDVLADLRKLRAAAARAGGRRRVDNAPPWQMSREVPARRRAPREARDCNCSPARSSRHPPRLSRPVPRAAAPADRGAAGCARSAGRRSRASSWRSPFADARSAPRRRRAWRAFRPAPPSANRCRREDDQRSSPPANGSIIRERFAGFTHRHEVNRSHLIPPLKAARCEPDCANRSLPAYSQAAPRDHHRLAAADGQMKRPRSSRLA